VSRTKGIFLTVQRRIGVIPSKTGEIDDMTATSYPEMPMFQRGKYQTTTPRDVNTVQKMNPRYTSAVASMSSSQEKRSFKT
jgi:hypothetical protein